MTQHIKQIAAKTRWHRKYHRTIAAALMAFFLFVSITGLLLGWKKNSAGFLLADSRSGSSIETREWVSFDSLKNVAVRTLADSLDPSLSPEIDRFDARPDKGMVKVTFKRHFNAIQLDAATGKVLLLEKRRADWIEKLHDGSLADHYLGLPGAPFKLMYTTVLALGLLFLTITGFWLWYNPKRIRGERNAKVI
jgi:hypothetical protein